MIPIRFQFFLPALVLVVVPVVVLCSFPLAPWLKMTLFASAGVVFVKFLTIAEYPHLFRSPFSRGQLAYLLWIGMSPEPFLTQSYVPRPLPTEIRTGLRHLFSGIVLIQLIQPFLAPTHPLLAGWTGMIGFLLVLHFGFFHLQSIWLRHHGFHAQPIMDRPLSSRNLGEFWGRRWNRAFTEPAFRLICRPMTRRFGPTTGILATFLISGLLHELAITIPSEAGHGGPTGYFLIQGLGLLMERTSTARSLGLGVGIRGRLYAWLVAGLPLPLLLPNSFVENVALPLFKAFTVHLP